MTDADFSARLLAWYERHGRHDLPWQHPKSAYRVWVSEIMLQQTQVATVIPYFRRFMQSFPTPRALAEAPHDEVLRHWAGLGYYARARNLHRAAQRIRDEHGGEVPDTLEALMELPGIGRSTAGAILSLAYGQRQPILDGNVKRVLARYHAVPGWPGETAVARTLWAHAEAHTPHERVADYTQAIMDLGATVCARSQPACGDCPLRGGCRAHAQGAVVQYPGARPKRERPHRRTRMLLIERAADEILLLRRPPTGIWGGLWCLPEPADADTRAWCRAELGLEVEPGAAGPVVQHGFTHFELDIHTEHVRVLRESDAIMEERDHVWYKVGRDTAPGLPAPVTKLVQTLYAPGAQPSLLPADDFSR